MSAVRNAYLDWLKETKQTSTPESQKQFFETFMTRIKDLDRNALAVIFSV